MKPFELIRESHWIEILMSKITWISVYQQELENKILVCLQSIIKQSIIR